MFAPSDIGCLGRRHGLGGVRRHRTGTGDGDIIAVVLSYHARDSTSIARSARTCSVCIIHLRRCTGDADAELEVEGNEWEKCMRERGEWEWDEGWGFGWGARWGAGWGA